MTAQEFDRISEAGADVRRIAETTVLVKVGDVPADQLWRHPAWPLCRGLAAVGFGAVHLRGAVDYFDDLADLLQSPRFTQEPGLWLAEATESLAPNADIVIDVTNDRAGKEACFKLALDRSSHFISLTWGRAWVSLACSSPYEVGEVAANVPEGTAPQPLLPIARVAGGLALQEALINSGRIEAACPPDPLVTCDFLSGSRTSDGLNADWPDLKITDAIIDVIGCGGIGVHFLEAFAPLLGRTCQLRIFDPDVVGGENLSSQIAYSGQDIGRPKVLAMAERLLNLCDRALAMWPFAVAYEDRPREMSPPTLRVSCVDNWGARKYLNDLALADGIPLIDAGSSPLAAQVRAYQPGQTACLEHRISNLAQMAADERASASCGRNRALTLPGTNMIAGGLLGMEAARTLRPEVFGSPPPGTITYDARFPKRFGITDIRRPCTHPPRDRRALSWPPRTA